MVRVTRRGWAALVTVLGGCALLYRRGAGDTVRQMAPLTIPYMEYMSRHLAVAVRVRNGLRNRNKVTVTLTNTGPGTVQSGTWRIYGFFLTYLRQASLPARPHFRLQHVTGSLYEISPTQHFTALSPGARASLTMTSHFPLLHYTDVPPNWYIADHTNLSRILDSTRETGSTAPRFVNILPSPHYPPYTPETRYAKQHVPDLGRAPHLVLPTPLEVTYKGAHTHAQDVTSEWTVVHEPHLASEAEFLATRLGVGVSQDPQQSGPVILLTQGPTGLPAPHSTNPEAYSVDVLPGPPPEAPPPPGPHTDPDGPPANQTAAGVNHSAPTPGPTPSQAPVRVRVVGVGRPGVFYGVQTLLGLVRRGEGGSRSIPVVMVRDAPRFPYRGLMVDLARNFHTLDELKTLIEGLALVKVNKLHLHLADDEGWRLEIPGLPELTQVGGRRCHAPPAGRPCLPPALGSGPHTNTSGSGHLTTTQYRALLRFARRRHVQVIPEFDMPGHSGAAVRSLQAGPARWRVTDPRAPASPSTQGYTHNVLSPCLPATYRLVARLITALIRMHKDIDPLTRLHVGGDEVPMDAFSQSPECHTYMRAHPEVTDVRELRIHFMKRVAALAAKQGIGIQAWEDGLYNGATMLPREELTNKDVVVNVWRNYWQRHLGNRTYELANAGYKVVLSHSSHFYFDHVQEPDPSERGLYWAMRYIDTRRIFNYVADDIYENIDLQESGAAWGREEACRGQVHCLPLTRRSHVLGLQGQVWGETVRSKNHLDLMVFPRMVALAERAWHKAPWEDLPDARRRQERWKDWIQFANSLGYKLLPALQGLGINYYLPPPGVVKDGGILLAAAMFPGLRVVYRTEGATDWAVWTDGNTIYNTTLFATRSLNGRRLSRIISISP